MLIDILRAIIDWWHNLSWEAITSLATAVGVYAVFQQAKLLRRSGIAETFRQLETRFYHSDFMREMRGRAACDLLSDKETSEAFDEVANFFEFAGILVRRKALDKEMARSSFYARTVTFWDEATKKGLVQRARQIRPTAWNDYEYLVKTLEWAYFWRYSYWNVLSREFWKFGGRSDKQPGELLDREKKLARVPIAGTTPG